MHLMHAVMLRKVMVLIIFYLFTFAYINVLNKVLQNELDLWLVITNLRVYLFQYMKQDKNFRLNRLNSCAQALWHSGNWSVLCSLSGEVKT